jgi:DNA helicase-4
MELDKYQKEAVIRHGNTILVAGAGAGKTFTILKKIEYLIENNICVEDEILIISFTNKSVDDLKKKIKYNIDVFTFHKLAIEILKEYNINYTLVSDDYLYYVANEFFQVIDDKEKTIILKKFHEYNYETFLNTFKYKEFIKEIVNVIKVYKTNACSNEDFKKIFYKDTFLSKYIYLIKKVYDQELEASYSMDFDDLIIKANNVLNKKFRYKYIIVDEFQDTSKIRFNLINKLRIINDAILFVVGDDYQSIYHFSGCNLNIFLEFQKLIPNAKLLKLKYTYRNSQELIDIASSFIMKNKLQLKKELVSFKHIDNPIKIVYYINPFKAFKKLYNKIYRQDNDILVLGRNNNDIKLFSKINDINYMTIHSAKGLEANNVILINLVDSLYGFPNKIKNNLLIEELHGSDKSIMYAEERRLFYVALTRTKNKIYLLVPIFKKSIFVKEIRKIMHQKK